MADNVAITPGSGVTIACDEVADGTLGTVRVQYVKIMDGTLDGTGKALVTSNGLQVAQGAANTSNPWAVRPRALNQYAAVYRLAARPYALSNAFGAAGRKQYATIFHGAAATKTVRLSYVAVAIESTTAAALVVAELIRLSSATTPATGNPAITPALFDPSDAAAEATCLALPTTTGTETGSPVGQVEWNLGITAAASTVNPPVPVGWVVLYSAAGLDERDQPTMRAGNAEGWAVTIDASALATVKGYVSIRFTEE